MEHLVRQARSILLVRSNGAFEVLGAKRGFVYEDCFNFAADVDLQKLVGLQGMTFHARSLPHRPWDKSLDDLQIVNRMGRETGSSNRPLRPVRLQSFTDRG